MASVNNDLVNLTDNLGRMGNTGNPDIDFCSEEQREAGCHGVREHEADGQSLSDCIGDYTGSHPVISTVCSLAGAAVGSWIGTLVGGAIGSPSGPGAIGSAAAGGIIGGFGGGVVGLVTPGTLHCMTYVCKCPETPPIETTPFN
jgi:hypothetical protein